MSDEMEEKMTAQSNPCGAREPISRAAPEAESVGPWKCPACCLPGTPEVVQIRQPDRSWADSTIRCCPQRDCKHTFGGSLADRLAHIRDIYQYKYFGDYELSPEQLDAVWEAKTLAERVPDLLEALTVIANASVRSEGIFGGKMSEVTRVFEHITRVARAAIAKAEPGDRILASGDASRAAQVGVKDPGSASE